MVITREQHYGEADIGVFLKLLDHSPPLVWLFAEHNDVLLKFLQEPGDLVQGGLIVSVHQEDSMQGCLACCRNLGRFACLKLKLGLY